MKMDRPPKLSLEYYEWHDVETFINVKHKCDIRDFAKHFGPKQTKILKGICEKHGLPWEEINTPKGGPDDTALRLKIFAEKAETDPPYQDFWHWLIKTFRIRDKDYFYLSSNDFVHCKEDWQRTILKWVLDEFAEPGQRVYFHWYR